MFRRLDTVPYPLYVVTVVFNPARYRTRWKLYQDFAKRCAEAGAILYVCEVAYGDREFVLEAPDGDPMRLLQLRTTDELWIKENALNLLIQRLPHDWESVLVADADCQLVRDDWADEILHGLQHYDILQPWSEAYDLTDQYEYHQKHHSFVYSWKNDEPLPDEPGYYYVTKGKKKVVTWHPGFMWAYRKHALNHLGGMIDTAILGSADMHMAKALIGRASTSYNPDVTDDYKQAVLLWQDRATKHIKQNVGYIPGLLLHHWHGPKAKRRYKDRWQILVKHAFQPTIDIKRDVQGLWQWTGDKSGLRDDVRNYFAGRDEDAPHNKD